MNSTRELILEYKKKRSEIRKRLREFKRNYRSDDDTLFSELCFCIVTPQSNACSCDRAINGLKKSRVLFDGTEHEIKTRLRGFVRFHNKKSAYIIGARRLFKKKGKDIIKSIVREKDIFRTREWLVRNIQGLGYKEASHFLRNIGLGSELAILDVHVLRNLKKYGVIKKIPASMSRDSYKVIEDKMRKFSKKIKIPLSEVDLLFWSAQTGFVFK